MNRITALALFKCMPIEDKRALLDGSMALFLPEPNLSPIVETFIERTKKLYLLWSRVALSISFAGAIIGGYLVRDIQADTATQVLDCVFSLQEDGPHLDHCEDEKGNRMKGAKITDSKCTDGPDENNLPDKCRMAVINNGNKGTAKFKINEKDQKNGKKLKFRVTMRGK